MSQPYILYGVPSWGSVLAEAMLTLAQASFRFEDVDGFDQPGPARDRLLGLNPLAQVPTLVLPDGQVMTESAAIALLLAERFPHAGLAPPADSPLRPHFLRRLVWLAAAVYSTFTYADYPERWSPEAPETLKTRVLDRRLELWRDYEAELAPDPWALGETFSALDIFIAVMTRWRPRRDWFAAECPKLAAIAARADALPALSEVWRRNF